MKTMFAAFLTAGMTVSGLAMTATPQQDSGQAASTVAGSAAAARGDHGAVTGTTGTH
jgi:hypothetical protein